MVDMQAMDLLVQLPADASQRQVLEAVSEMEGLHRPVRRAEKKYLNDAQ